MVQRRGQRRKIVKEERPLEPEQLRIVVKNFLENSGQPNRFCNNTPGPDWMKSFQLRWNHRLRIRKPEYVTTARAKGLTEEVLNGFFEIVTNLVNELGVAELPNRFYNLDEVGLALDPKARKCFYHKGVKNAQFLVPTEGKTMFTFLFCGNASGQYLPPYVVYKGRGNHIMDSWMVGGPDQCAYKIRKSGWMEAYIFESWFREVFLRQLEGKPKPILVFFDGHGSHLTYQTASKAKATNVHLVCLPPKTSSALQPLDVACYEPPKREWYRILSNFYRETRQKTVQKPAYPRLLKLLFENAFVGKPENMMSGFRKCCLHSVNKEALPKAKLLPSTALIPSVEQPATVSSTSASESEQQMTPHKAMRLAIVATVCPPVSESTRQALENAGRKRRRVQKRHGEVLTWIAHSSGFIEKKRNDEEKIHIST